MDPRSFNPRLTSAARRTNSSLVTRIAKICFNPRLTSAARRTKPTNNRGNDAEVSIRASLQQRGELIQCPFYLIVKEVSIRASLQQRGELPSLCIFPTVLKSFNPRLTSAARRTGESDQR